MILDHQISKFTVSAPSKNHDINSTACVEELFGEHWGHKNIRNLPRFQGKNHEKLRICQNLLKLFYWLTQVLPFCLHLLVFLLYLSLCFHFFFFSFSQTSNVVFCSYLLFLFFLLLPAIYQQWWRRKRKREKRRERESQI